MAVQLTIPYETLVQLVDQLTPTQRLDLLRHLRESNEASQSLTVEEKKALLRKAQQIFAGHTINEVPPVRREDWYSDDGR